ncbi:hypothetical protein QCA50_014156 [Cerrena zonata]|uniref:Timeless N-terminal domain-containing protein n=1 Tax=Cerrena zonata TaxID=2478898 RepID=A0AAW0FYR2_9APHY
MNREDPIEISSDEEENYSARRTLLEPAIRSVVDALGGYEGGLYRLGDECYGCLKDLKKFWRKDDTDDERTVARIFWETRLLPNDLIPILLETAGKGHFEDKRAIACADLMTAMTWPIDLAEELREIEEMDERTDYTQLLQAHLAYKAALLKPGVMQALFGIMLSCLSKDTKTERTDRDVQIMNVVLYLIRNLAFIKDLPANMHLSADQAEYSSMQTRLVKALSETNTFDLLLMMASNAPTDPTYNSWNTLILEIFYLLFRGLKPSSLIIDQTKQPAKDLQRLLAVEDGRKRNISRNASSRHSRFGTTIAIMSNPKKQTKPKAQAPDEDATEAPTADGDKSAPLFVLHRQRALHRDAGSVLDMSSAKRAKIQKKNKTDELGREDNLSSEARSIIQGIARTFIEACFNPFLSSLLKDIKAERPKITEKDNLRLLYLTKWFLEYFHLLRAQDKERVWDYGLVAEVIERGWIAWVLKRIREAGEEKPKLWTELQAGIECLTQLVTLVDAMASTDSDPEIAETARILQQQIVYNGEILDITLESVRTYKEGTQSLRYLDSSVHLAYALLRMLERWSKRSGEMYVRKKAKKKTKARRDHDTEAGPVPDVEEEPEPEPDEEVIHETMFTFDSFEARFAHPDITNTLLTYLSRYEEFSSAENMKRVVNLIHRQAVKAKAEGLYFQVSTFNLFKSILASEKTLPKDKSYKELVMLINFILRQFFKAVEGDSFLLVQAFFPKNRGQWKNFSSWEPEERPGRKGREPKALAELQVKSGFKWSEELAIAIAALLEEGKTSLIDWTKEILIMVMGIRQRIVEDTDGSSSQVKSEDEDEDLTDEQIKAKATAKGELSSEAASKFTDYMIPYINDEQANAATKDPHLKLLFRLVNFFVRDEDADEPEWYVPAAIFPAEMQRTLNVINQFLDNPMDLEGKKASELLQKKRKRRRRRRSPSNSGDDEGLMDDEPKKRKRKEKKKKEEKMYKSATLIEDSDADEEEMKAFFEKEKALRQRTALAAASTGKVATMKATGTKKRRKRNPADGAGDRKRKKSNGSDEEEEPPIPEPNPAVIAIINSSDEEQFDPFASPKSMSKASPNDAPKPRPRPRPRARRRDSSPGTSEAVTSPPPSEPLSRASSALPSRSSPAIELSSDEDIVVQQYTIKRKPIVISDEE